LGLKEASEYSDLLRKAEKAKDIRERISTARTGYRKTMETRGGTGMVTTSNTNNYVQKPTASGETNIYVHNSAKDSGMTFCLLYNKFFLRKLLVIQEIKCKFYKKILRMYK